MSDSIQSVNLADDSQYVSLNVDTSQPPPSTATTTVREAETTTAFVEQEKNLAQQQTGMMDSTPISDLMMEDAGPGFMDQQQPMLQQQPRMQSLQMQAPAQGQMMPMMPQQQEQVVKPESKNFMNLTDDQLIALVAGVAASIAISKPVQDKLVTSVPNFLDNAGSRSMVGLAATGAVAALVFYIAKSYVVSR